MKWKYANDKIIVTLHPFMPICTGSRQQKNNNAFAIYYNTLKIT